MTERLFELERQEDMGEVGRAVVENLATAEISKRVVPYPLRFSKEGEVDFLHERETVLGRAECVGMDNIFSLAQKYDYIFWFSPPGGRSGYNEGRLVVGKVINRKDGVEIESRGIPILVESEEMLEMARDIYAEGGASEDFVTVAEDLREQAIGINLEGDLWDFCEEILGMEEVWQAIREGKDVEMTNQAIGVTERVIEKVKQELGGVTVGNSRLAGAMFERLMAMEGYRMAGGNHGGLSGKDSLFGNVFNGGRKTKVDSKGNILTRCEGCGHWYSGDECPYCV